MDFEPQKFFIGVIDLFSILMPGAVLSYYTYRRVPSSTFGLNQWHVQGAEGWLIFLFSSYLLGHFLFFIGSWLDDFAYDPLRSRTRKEQIRRILSGRELSPKPVRWLASVCFKDNPDAALDRVLRLRDHYLGRISSPKAVNAFQWCKARLAVDQHEALATVNRFEADSKFFRSFVPVMLIVIVNEIVMRPSGWQVWSAVAGVAMVLAFLRYAEQRFKSTQQAYWFVLTLEAKETPATKVAYAVAPRPEVKKERLTHAGGVVHRKSGAQTQVLMLQAKDDAGEWVLPKGHIEAGEDPQSTAIREVREETGVWAKIVQNLGTPDTDERAPVKVLYYLMEPVDEGLPEDLLRECRWVDLQNSDEIAKRAGVRIQEKTQDVLNSAGEALKKLAESKTLN